MDLDITKLLGFKDSPSRGQLLCYAFNMLVLTSLFYYIIDLNQKIMPFLKFQIINGLISFLAAYGISFIVFNNLRKSWKHFLFLVFFYPLNFIYITVVMVPIGPEDLVVFLRSLAFVVV